MTTLTGTPDPTVARAVRRAQNLTIAQVAEAAGVDRPVVSRVERGREGPTDRVRQRIAAALGIDPAEVTDAPR